MKRKNSETTPAQNFAGLLQEIKSILPERFASRKITELEQTQRALESATIEDLRNIKTELETFKPLLDLRYCKAELKAHQENITLKIEEIDTILRSVELPQNTRPKLDTDRAEEEDEIEDSDLEEDEIVDSDEEAPIAPAASEEEEDEERGSEAENTPPSDTSSQNSTDPLSSYPDGTPHDHYNCHLVQAHQPSLDPNDSLTSVGETPSIE